MVSHRTLQTTQTPHVDKSDLEKRQERFRSGELNSLPPHIVKLADGTCVEARPAGTGLFSAFKSFQTLPDQDVIGAWKD
jgi:hypothetical protein